MRRRFGRGVSTPVWMAALLALLSCFVAVAPLARVAAAAEATPPLHNEGTAASASASAGNSARSGASGSGSASALPPRLTVLSSGLEIHTIALTGFPQQQQSQQQQQQQQPPLPASHPLSSSPPPRTVSPAEALVGFVKVAVATVTFDRPVWVHRDALTAPVGEPVPYGFMPSPATAARAANTTGDLYGTVGLARLVCAPPHSRSHAHGNGNGSLHSRLAAGLDSGSDSYSSASGALVFDSFPSPSQSHAPPRFLVPSEHLSLYLSELPAVTAALPGLMACPASTHNGSSSPSSPPSSSSSSSSGPGASQLSFVLLMSHSRAGLPSLEHLTDADLASCRLAFPPRRAQGWRPAGALAAAADADAPVFAGSVPLPLVQRQAREHFYRTYNSNKNDNDANAVNATSASASASASVSGRRLRRPLPGPGALSDARAALGLCWTGARGGFAGFRAPARERLLPADAAVKRALEMGTEDLLSGRAQALLAGPSFPVAHGAADAVHGGVGGEFFGPVTFLQHQSLVFDRSNTRANGNANMKAGGERFFGENSLAAGLVADSLSSSLVVHSEPWVLSLLETGSELSHDATLRSMGAAGNMMMGLLSGAFAPAIKPLVPGVSAATSGDVQGALMDPVENHIVQEVSQGIIDALEPLLTGEIALSVVPALIETITDETIEGAALEIADQVALDATPILTRDITKRVTRKLVPFVAESISTLSAIEIVKNLTRPLASVLPRALAHAIVPALSQTLTLSPDQHEHCYKCVILADAMACMQCPEDKKSTDAFGLPPSLYYALYYTGYYSTYFGGYYADVFANSPGLRVVRRRVLDPNDPVPDPMGFEGDGPGQI